MHLPVTFNYHSVLYKFQNNISKFKMVADKKRIKTKKLLTVPKLYYNAEHWRLRKVMWMAKRQRQKYKPLQSTYNLVHGVEQEPKGAMQKQTKGKWQ